jgi:hypothetical protein
VYDHSQDWEGDFCRCGQITNARVTSVNSARMAKAIASHYGKGDIDDPIWQYALERVCSTYEPDDFHVGVVGGYYGEEIGRVTLQDDTRIRQFLGLDYPTEWIEFALAKEYGFVLPKLSGKDWMTKRVRLDEVKLPNTYRDFNVKMIEHYQGELERNPKLILSCLVDEDMNIVDGYHRYFASMNAKKRKIDVIKPK